MSPFREVSFALLLSFPLLRSLGVLRDSPGVLGCPLLQKAARPQSCLSSVGERNGTWLCTANATVTHTQELQGWGGGSSNGAADRQTT